MPKFLSQKQVDQFYEEGFLSPLDVMSEDEALSYKSRLEEAALKSALIDLKCIIRNG